LLQQSPLLPGFQSADRRKRRVESNHAFGVDFSRRGNDFRFDPFKTFRSLQIADSLVNVQRERATALPPGRGTEVELAE
jgi:hypothetical protein